MQNAPIENIPGHLLALYAQVVCAYPNGLPNKDYYPLIGALVELIAPEDVARLISTISAHTYSDVYQAAVEFTPGQFAGPFDVEKVRNRLDDCAP